MKLILAYGGGSGYYPYTQKPADYQPYRPVYLFRGPPPDAGFSYGLFEDEEAGVKYYGEMGLEPFSPFSGKNPKLLEEVGDGEALGKLLGDDLKKENLEEVACGYCGASYLQNLRSRRPEGDLWCHRCGGKLYPISEKEKLDKDLPKGGEAGLKSQNGELEGKEAEGSGKGGGLDSLRGDPKTQKFVGEGLKSLLKSSQMKELVERLSLEYNLPKEKAQEGVLWAFKETLDPRRATK